MRSSIKTPIIILLLVAVAFLLVKGLMYMRVKSMMDDLVQEAASEVEITYNGISTELTGAATVEGIRIRPLTVQTAVQIDHVRFSSEDPWALITGGDWREDEPPEQMQFALHGVRVALDDQMIEAIKSQAALQGEVSPQSSCMDGFNMDPEMLRELGFEELVMDANMEYRFDVPAERLHASFGFELLNIESAQMSVELAGVVPQDVAQQRLSAPSLASAEMSVDMNKDFGDRYLELCAQRAGLTPEAYRNELLERMQEEMAAAGVTLGDGLQQAMADMYREWGELRIRVRPSKPLGPMQMLQIGPQNFVEQLGISLRINDQPVPDLSFDFDMQQLFRQAQGGEAAAVSGMPGNRPAPKRVRVTRRYERIALARLEDHIGGMVKIKPVGQPLRSGQLIAIAEGDAQIRQRAHGGSFTSHVPLRDIEAVEVQVVERGPVE